MYIVEGYVISDFGRYPHIAIGVRPKTKERKTFLKSYVKLSPEQRAEQNAYWDEVEKDFKEADIVNRRH